ncbi:unknown [Clostridium sp. CAG:356]|nr:unknown [Clostridium sp. CAG:356]
MVVKDKKIEKVYSSYVSEYHLEMILVPFINSKIEEKENVVIETEYDMNETLNTLLSKLNLKEENKEKILRLGWNKKENNIESKDNVIIIGNKDYIENTNRRIMQKNIEDLTIVDCYKFEDICNNMSEVADKYDFNLNTNGLQ